MQSGSKEVSKLISYWLRHSPSEANLTVDDLGWVSLSGIIAALKTKGQTLTYEDIIELNLSFDKVRWEVNSAENKIRATHGHSYPVLLDEKIQVPPEILYHGTSTNNLDNIIKIGLKPMGRQFVHLSENIETALEVGKRHGKSIVFKIDAELFHQHGGIFYKTSDNVWLTKEVPAAYANINGWHPVEVQDITRLKEELIREVPKDHILYNKLTDLELIMRRYDRDDCLFVDKNDNTLFVVHLTWSKETNAAFPWTRSYKSLLDCINDRS